MAHDRAGDVVGHVGYDQIWPAAGELAHVTTQDVGIDEFDVGRAGEARFQQRLQAFVQFNGDDVGSLPGQYLGERAGARADLNDGVSRLDGGAVGNLLQRVRIVQEVLAEALLRFDVVGCE